MSGAGRTPEEYVRLAGVLAILGRVSPELDSRDERLFVASARSHAGDALVMLAGLLGPGAYFWYAPGSDTGASNFVEARDAAHRAWGVGQTDNQALKDAAGHWRAEQARKGAKP